MALGLCWAGCALGLTPGTLWAETIYLSRSATGKAVYSNAPRGAAPSSLMQLPAQGHTPVVLRTLQPSAGVHSARGPRPAGARPDGAMLSLIQQASRRHNIDVHLLAALIRHESAFNPEAVSHAGARGLMQLMPGTAARYGVGRVHDPGENIAGGSAYLRDLLDLFGRTDLALAAYNAGEGAVMRYGRQIPPFAETQNYVRVVMAEYERRRAAVPH